MTRQVNMGNGWYADRDVNVSADDGLPIDARDVPVTTLAVASDYNLWREYFDCDGLDSQSDFDALTLAERIAYLARAGFGRDLEPGRHLD